MEHIVVIGASWGGVEALQRLAGGLTRDFPAAVLVVLHIGNRPSRLAQVLSTPNGMPVSHPSAKEVLRPGHMYVAPPDHHMLLEDDHVILNRGPKEHHTRPSIDPLFRSAALAKGPAVIGVVLTGMLDDGTSGLQAVKECGGTTVVQSPEDAYCPDMPRSALKYVAIDHCVALDAMPRLLNELISRKVEDTMSAPPTRLVEEQAVSSGTGDPIAHLKKVGTTTTFTCPDCHGSLWKLAGPLPERFMCHTGHVFTQRSLQHTMAGASDDAVWNALRSIQEHALLLRYFAESETAAAPRNERAAGLLRTAQELEAQVQTLHRLIDDRPESPE